MSAWPVNPPMVDKRGPRLEPGCETFGVHEGKTFPLGSPLRWGWWLRVFLFWLAACERATVRRNAGCRTAIDLPRRRRPF